MFIVVNKRCQLYNWVKTTLGNISIFSLFSISFGGEKILGFGVEEETNQPHSPGWYIYPEDGIIKFKSFEVHHSEERYGSWSATSLQKNKQ